MLPQQLPVLVIGEEVTEPVKGGLVLLSDVFPSLSESVDRGTLEPRHNSLQAVNVVELKQFL